MTDWALWFVMAGLAIGVELFTGTFYLLVIALGLAAGGGVALLGGVVEWQLLAAALVGVIAAVALRRGRFGRMRKDAVTRDPNVLFDIGQSIRVDRWRDEDGIAMARERYRGAEWDVELVAGNPVQSGMFVIREIRGNRLIVSHQQGELHVR